MLKNLSQLEAKITTVINDNSVEKIYHFSCDQDSPIPAVKEALVKFMAFVSQIEDKIKEQQEAAKAAGSPVEEKVEPIITPEA